MCYFNTVFGVLKTWKKDHNKVAYLVKQLFTPDLLDMLMIFMKQFREEKKYIYSLVIYKLDI